jgi:hypothetical protein
MKSESRWPAEAVTWLDGRGGGAGTNVRRLEKRREAAWIRAAAATEECLVFSELTRNRKPNGNSGGPSRKYKVGRIAIYIYETSPIYRLIYELYHIYVGNIT